MMISSREEALARRRTQNRLAQRRYRSKLRRENPSTTQTSDRKIYESGGIPIQGPDSHVAALTGSAPAGVDGNFVHLRAQEETLPMTFPSTDLPDLATICGPQAYPYLSPAAPTCRFALFGNALLFRSWGERKGGDLPSAVPDDLSGGLAACTAADKPGSLVVTEAAADSPSKETPPPDKSAVSVPVPPPASTQSLLPFDLEEKHLRSSPSQLEAVPHMPEGAYVAQDRLLSVLHMAALRDHSQIVRVLLQHPGVNCNEKDSDGRTPLFYAIGNGSQDMVQGLLEHGAHVRDVVTSSQQRNALHWAILQRHEGILRLLLEHCGGDEALVNGYDSTGMTPLHLAVDTGFETGVHLLLQHGANPNCKTGKDAGGTGQSED